MLVMMVVIIVTTIPSNTSVFYSLYVLTSLTHQLRGVSQFLLQLDTAKTARRKLGRRHTSPYVSPEGTCPVCQLATVFTLVGDQLYADKKLVTASDGEDHEPLLARSSNASIDSGFALVNGHLEWRHPHFTSEAATFCLSSHNDIHAVFNLSAIPSDCAPVNLIYVPCKSLEVSDVAFSTNLVVRYSMLPINHCSHRSCGQWRWRWQRFKCTGCTRLTWCLQHSRHIESARLARVRICT